STTAGTAAGGRSNTKIAGSESGGTVVLSDFVKHFSFGKREGGFAARAKGTFADLLQGITDPAAAKWAVAHEDLIASFLLGANPRVPVENPNIQERRHDHQRDQHADQDSSGQTGLARAATLVGADRGDHLRTARTALGAPFPFKIRLVSHL